MPAATDRSAPGAPDPADVQLPQLRFRDPLPEPLAFAVLPAETALPSLRFRDPLPEPLPVLPAPLARVPAQRLHSPVAQAAAAEPLPAAPPVAPAPAEPSPAALATGEHRVPVVRFVALQWLLAGAPDPLS